MLAMSWRNHEEVLRTIRETRALTRCPFGVNFALEWDQSEQLNICLELIFDSALGRERDCRGYFALPPY